MNPKKIYKIIITLIILFIIGFLAWYFKFITCCILIAIVLTLMGEPLLRMLQHLRIGKHHIGKNGVSIITLFIIIGIIFSLLYWFFPMIFSQAMQIANMDTSGIVSYIEKYSMLVKQYLIDYGVIDAKTSLEVVVNREILSVLKNTRFDIIFSDIFSIASNIILGFFVILFTTFFLLRDKDYFTRLIYSAVPEIYAEETSHILHNSRKLISRYFIGLGCEILMDTLLLFIGFTIVGFPNALLLAFCCGILVIIPYVGAIIGGILSYLILIASMISSGIEFQFLTITLTFAIIFIAVKLIDDFIIQPFIYSKSVKAHPLEIFLVILLAGEMGGIVGMIVAIPFYTLLRIIVKEFYSKSRFVQNFIKGI